MGVPAMRKRDGIRLLASIIPNDSVLRRAAPACARRPGRPRGLRFAQPATMIIAFA
jgi:hypothetical protein